MKHEQNCPVCGAHASIIVVGDRAWCVEQYVKGGCGSHWRAKTYYSSKLGGQINEWHHMHRGDGK